MTGTNDQTSSRAVLSSLMKSVWCGNLEFDNHKLQPILMTAVVVLA